MMPHILILVEQPAYTQQLQGWLEGHYTVQAGANTLNENFDLCIVDAQALDHWQADLFARRQVEQPIFLPVLLLMARDKMALLPAEIWQYVDDVITHPVEPMELQTRLEMLLRARHFSQQKQQQASTPDEQCLLAEALRDTATALTSTLELPQVFERILMNVGRVVPHDAAYIELIEEGVGQVVRSRGYARYGLEHKIRRQHLNIEEAAHLKQMARSRQPLVIPDVSSYPGQAMLRADEQFPASYVGAPIYFDGEMIGFIHLGSSTPHFFTPVHADRLRAFAEQAAIAIQNARLFEERQVLAAMEERQRIARDLHDAVSQTLFSANVIAETLPRLWERDPERAKEKLSDLQRLTRGAMAETRAVLWELQPTAMEIIDLSGLLREMAAALRNRKRLNVLLKLDEEPPIPNEIKIILYRIVQEALNNIIKHARATEVRLELQTQPGMVRLVIQDNGRGFDPNKPWGEGLQGMAERAAEIDATFKVTSAQGNGTQVSVSWANQARKK